MLLVISLNILIDDSISNCFELKELLSEIDMKLKDQKTESQPKDPIKNFEKLLITEKDNFNKSQNNFLEPQKIKIGER